MPSLTRIKMASSPKASSSNLDDFQAKMSSLLSVNHLVGGLSSLLRAASGPSDAPSALLEGSGHSSASPRHARLEFPQAFPVPPRTRVYSPLTSPPPRSAPALKTEPMGSDSAAPWRLQQLPGFPSGAYGKFSGSSAAPPPESSVSAGEGDGDCGAGGTGGDEGGNARHLSKLKRFLTTLQQFGFDISPEIGEKVRGLVLALVNSHISIEDFHARLHESTNFPLRPFVIPFLKANLPLLQQELQVQGRSQPTLTNRLHSPPHSGQSHEDTAARLLNIKLSPVHSSSSSSSSSQDVNKNGKRPYSRDRLDDKRAKRSDLDPIHGGQGLSPYGPGLTGPIRLEDVLRLRAGGAKGAWGARREGGAEERVAEREGRGALGSLDSMDYLQHFSRMEEDWKYVNDLLQCIVGMVDKCKRILSVLESHARRPRGNEATEAAQPTGSDASILQPRQDLAPPTHDSQVAEAARRMEEMLVEVRTQARLELQKAVGAAELKAAQIVAAERRQMEVAVEGVRQQTRRDVIALLARQEDSSETCLNCGREASETCSGCRAARYCGAFCQHRHWEQHHRVCCGTITNTNNTTTNNTNTNANSDNTSSGRHRENNDGSDEEAVAAAQKFAQAGCDDLGKNLCDKHIIQTAMDVGNHVGSREARRISADHADTYVGNTMHNHSVSPISNDTARLVIGRRDSDEGNNRSSIEYASSGNAVNGEDDVTREQDVSPTALNTSKHVMRRRHVSQHGLESMPSSIKHSNRYGTNENGVSDKEEHLRGCEDERECSPQSVLNDDSRGRVSGDARLAMNAELSVSGLLANREVSTDGSTVHLSRVNTKSAGVGE